MFSLKPYSFVHSSLIYSESSRAPVAHTSPSSVSLKLFPLFFGFSSEYVTACKWCKLPGVAHGWFGARKHDSTGLAGSSAQISALRISGDSLHVLFVQFQQSLGLPQVLRKVLFSYRCFSGEDSILQDKPLATIFSCSTDMVNSSL